MNVRSTLAIAALISAASVSCAQPPTTQPPKTDYAAELARLHESALPAEGRDPSKENAWPIFAKWLEDLCVQQAKVMEWPPPPEPFNYADRPDDAVVPNFLLVYEPPDAVATPEQAAERDAALKVIAHLEKANFLATLKRLNTMPRVVRPIGPEGRLVELRLSELGVARLAARIEWARMHRAAERGDEHGVIDGLENSLTLARFVGMAPALISRMVVSALTSGCADRASFAIQSLGSLSAKELARAAADLERFDAWSSSWETAYRSERLIELDTVQWLYGEVDPNDKLSADALARVVKFAGQIDGREAADAPPADDAAVALIYATMIERLKTKKETIEQLDSLFEPFFKHLSGPRFDREPVNYEEKADVIGKSNLVLGVLLPIFGKGLASADNERTKLAALRLFIAIERFRLEHKKPPAAIADLVPAFLPAIPIDQWNKDGFIYRVDPAARRGYVLYSLGRDGVDNAMKMHPQSNDFALYAKDGDGFDYVIVGAGEPVRP